MTGRQIEKTVDHNRVEDCPFCYSQENPSTKSDLVWPIDPASDVELRPDGSMLVPGHFLLLTTDHLTSFAQLDPSRLKDVDSALTPYEDELGQIFGRYFRLEHGSDNARRYGSGACIDHAHLHLIPADEQAGPSILSQLPWQRLDSLEDLAWFRNSPYIYLGRLGEHYVVPRPDIPGQWVRKETASAIGNEVWDWALLDGRTELQETLRKLKDSSLDNLHLSRGNDEEN